MSFGVSDETRTRDPLIKSQMLYRLSYGNMAPRKGFEPLSQLLDRRFSRPMH